MRDDPIPESRYAKLAEQEARFWGNVRSRDDNPQLWDDPILFSLFLRPRWEHLVQSVVNAGGDVLDVGCGEGHLAITLAKRGVRVKGMDISAERISRANERAKSEFSEFPDRAPAFEVADLNTITLPRETYDVVVAHDALHHILRLDHLLGEISRGLKIHGRLIVYDYVGMGSVRKVLAALSYAILPTYQSYGSKLKLSRRFARFMKGEEGKRRELNLESAATAAESPFEEISQESIVPLIGRMFRIEEQEEEHPFFFYLAPKLRCYKPLQPAFWRTLRFLDEAVLSSGLARGAYVFITAVKRI